MARVCPVGKVWLPLPRRERTMLGGGGDGDDMGDRDEARWSSELRTLEPRACMNSFNAWELSRTFSSSFRRRHDWPQIHPQRIVYSLLIVNLALN